MSGIANHRAEPGHRLAVGQSGHVRGQVGEVTALSEQRIEACIAQGLESEREAIGRRAPMPAYQRDTAHLARPDPQPPGVEVGAERHARLVVSEPGHLDHLGIGSGQPQRGGQALFTGGAVHDEVTVTQRVLREVHSMPSRSHSAARAGSISTN